MIKKIVLASGNQGKLNEFSQLFADTSVTIIPQSELNISDAEETGLTFIENALIKARHAAKVSSLPAIADDSGLAVDALGGAPGIYSARYAGEHGNNAANNEKLLHNMQAVTNRAAKFICVLAFLRHADDPTPIVCQGEWHGTIAKSLSGTQGFGYDPLFYVESEGKTAAELDKERKNSISHRAQALQVLFGQLKNELQANLTST